MSCCDLDLLPLDLELLCFGYHTFKLCTNSGVTGGGGGPPRVTPSMGDTRMKLIFALNLKRTLEKRRWKAERVGVLMTKQ